MAYVFLSPYHWIPTKAVCRTLPLLDERPDLGGFVGSPMSEYRVEPLQTMLQLYLCPLEGCTRVVTEKFEAKL